MRDRINASLKDAMKAQDKCRICTLRLINAAIKDRDIAARGQGKDKVGDEEVAQIMGKMIRQRQESAKLYEEGGRLELAEQERQEITVIEEFLPKQLGDSEMRQACAQAVSEVGARSLKDMGRTMNALKERYPGQMDMGRASSVVKQMLG